MPVDQQELAPQVAQDRVQVASGSSEFRALARADEAGLAGLRQDGG
jgi:hypothetical protein